MSRPEAGRGIRVQGRTRAQRAIKDVVEERLFARRRNLFNDLDLVFFDTSALYFHGEGGQTLGRRASPRITIRN